MGSTAPSHETLARLRAVLEAIRAADGKALPAIELARLRDELGAEGVTIDLDAAAQLGQPMVVIRVAREVEPAPCFALLSRRERDGAELVAVGLRNKDIALALGISVGTVKDHVHRILTKTGLDGRAQVAAAWLGA